MQTHSNTQNEIIALISFAELCRCRRDRRLKLKSRIHQRSTGDGDVEKAEGRKGSGRRKLLSAFFNSKSSQTCLALIFNSYFHYSLFAL